MAALVFAVISAEACPSYFPQRRELCVGSWEAAALSGRASNVRSTAMTVARCQAARLDVIFGLLRAENGGFLPLSLDDR
ncbi:hypothetical protein [Pseudaminobacter sp. NGMCC 1.201702]|uniref:hypothetical protein n=1 Tax=Pseudaminobacter sp. NGMCC 1.201702 TaxID=3391825 RepID=UPI0039EEDA8B